MQEVNLTSVYLCCKAALPHMLEQGSGSIINTASFVAVMGAATSQISYSASKGGVLTMSRELGVQSGFAIKPGTAIEPYLDDLEHFDQVMVMSVEPGFGGQKFMPEVLSKVMVLRDRIAEASLDTIIGIDGGIANATIAQAAEAGVDAFVAGSAVFGADNPGEAVERLRELAREAARG